MVQFLPWKRSIFYTESKGFPTMGTLQLTLTVKTIQTLMSVICQIYYMTKNSNLDNPTASPNAKGLFFANIFVSGLGVIFGVITLFMKQKLLQGLDEKNETEKEKRLSARKSAMVELGAVYGDEEEDGVVIETDNPLYALGAGGDEDATSDTIPAVMTNNPLSQENDTTTDNATDATGATDATL
jgi:hypothetical protein